MHNTLLITDDALIIRTMIRDAATAAGWEVVAEAMQGQEAMDAYARTRPTAVTLDLVMPEYDGLYALRGIREMDPEALIIVVSALEQRSVLKEAFRLGASDFMVKPFDKRALIATLEQIVAAPAPIS